MTGLRTIDSSSVVSWSFPWYIMCSRRLSRGKMHMIGGNVSIPPRPSSIRRFRRFSPSIGMDSSRVHCTLLRWMFSFLENPKMCTTDIISTFTPNAYAFISFEIGSIRHSLAKKSFHQYFRLFSFRCRGYAAKFLGSTNKRNPSSSSYRTFSTFMSVIFSLSLSLFRLLFVLISRCPWDGTSDIQWSVCSWRSIVLFFMLDNCSCSGIDHDGKRSTGSICFCCSVS